MDMFYLRQYGYIEYAVTEDRTASVVYINVHEQYRRMGYGTILMKKFAEFLKKRRIWKIELENMLESENKFYDKLGFKYVDKYDCTMRVKTYSLCKKKLIKKNIY